MRKFAYIWEYDVPEAKIESFIKAYGQEGVWVKFFSRDDSYIETKLHRDLTNPNRFVTTDYWISKAARDAFRQKFAREFEEIDERCETLTETEVFIGDFEIVD